MKTNNKKNKVIVILGPTAIGKSALGIKLAQQVNGEVISGDSMQVYRHLDIGTAKVSIEEQNLVKHHLIDICDVSQRYTVKNFQDQANDLIVELKKNNKIPIIVGGTGFYLNALVQGMNLGGEEPEIMDIREKYENLLKNKGKEWLYEKLKNIDYKAAEKIEINNTRRVIRALEVNELGKTKFSEQVNGGSENEYLLIGLFDDRAEIYNRINNRVDLMIQQGLLEEAKWLYDRRESVPQAKNGIGYKELFAYFDGDIDLDESIRLLKRNTRRFAKRQLTYFRNQMDAKWFDISDEKLVDKVFKEVNYFLK